MSPPGLGAHRLRDRWLGPSWELLVCDDPADDWPEISYKAMEEWLRLADRNELWDGGLGKSTAGGLSSQGSWKRRALSYLFIRGGLASPRVPLEERPHFTHHWNPSA